MKIKVLQYLIILIAFISCEDSNSKLNLNEETPIKIVVINKTGNKTFTDTLTITDSVYIKEFIAEVAKMYTLSEANVKANNGFFEVALHYSNGETIKYDIIETAFDGIIIYTQETTRHYYKNNRLYNLLLRKYNNSID